MKKLIVLIMCLAIFGLSISYGITFSDIGGHWAEANILNLAEKGVINGYPDGTYMPEKAVTKGEFMKLIMVASLPEKDFTKVYTEDTHWASPYIALAEQEDIIEVENVYYEETDDIVNISNMSISHVDEPISRLEMVEVLSKCDITFKGTEQTGIDLEFTDVENLDSMQKTLLRHAVAKGYISGYPDGTFGPGRTLTRAEVATILTRY